MNTLLDPTTQQNVDTWLKGHYDQETKNEIQRLLKEHPQEIVDAFYTKLAFGTAGMRGLMGIGTNRMNKYTIGAATQALANYLNKQPKKDQEHSVLIGYDSRKNSKYFAEEAAKVLAGNGIRTYLCSDLRPTPYVSFGCRHKHCSAAIMITASHNPAQYNGYKVYWNDGGQVTAPHDINIIKEFNAITDIKMVKQVKDSKHPLIELVDRELDQAYLSALAKLQNYPKENRQHGSTLKIVYTSLHGTGMTMMPQAARDWGFSNLIFVDKQVIPDGNFPTVKVPNPEEPEALKLGIETMKQAKADLLIANDPDADRVAVVVHHKDSYQMLNGNQIACLCLYHVCEALSTQKKLPEKAAFIKSVVTTEMFRAISEAYGRPTFDVLTGFKFIAAKIREWEQQPNGYKYIFGGEESYGYLLGTQERDKDAILAGVLISEAALHAKLQGKTLLDKLDDLYKKFGFYFEEVVSVNFEETKAGKEKMNSSLEKFYAHPPTQIVDTQVVKIEDYRNSFRKNLLTGEIIKLDFPVSDMLLFWLSDGSKIVVRPSGTEPKIKLYCGTVEKKFSNLEQARLSCKRKADQLLSTVKKMLTKE